MPRLQVRQFADPDELRQVPKATYQMVKLDDPALTHAVFEPGWRWSVDMAPLFGTTSCPVHHLGYVMSGLLRVVMDDGQALDIGPGAVYEIPPGHDAWVVGEEPWVTIDTTSGRVMTSVLDVASERVVATVLFSDIVDSTATIGRIGDTAWRDTLLAHNRRLRDEINLYRGREIATTGDGFLAVFDGATRAVRCATAMVASAQAMGVTIRVGIHTGELEFVGPDARGLAVHTAARVLSAAGPGEVLVSSTTRDLLEGSGVAATDAGVHQLKGLDGPRQLYRVVQEPRSSRT